MLVVFLTGLCSFAVEQSAANAQAPFRVELHALETTRLLNERMEVIDAFGLLEQLPESVVARWTTIARDDGTSPELPGLFGTASFVLPSGELFRVVVRTFPNDEEFERQLAAFVDRFAADGAMHRSGDRITITFPPSAPPADKSRPHLTYRPFHIVYRDGIKISSDSELLFTVPVQSLVDDVKQAQGKDFYTRFAPGAIPETVRERFLREFTLVNAVNAQGRDGEAPSASTVRRSAYEGARAFVESLLFDLDECVCWLEAAGENGRQDGYGQIKARDGTSLADLITTLGARSPYFSQAGEDDSIARLSVHAFIPEQFRDLTVSMLRDSGFAELGLYSLIEQQIAAGYLEFHASVIENTDKLPQLVAVLRTDSLPRSLEDLARVTGSTHESNGTLSRKVNLTFPGLNLGVHQMKVAAEDGCVSLAIAQESPQLRSSLVDEIEDPAPAGLRTLARLEVDLSRWGTPGSNAATTNLLQRFERAWESALLPPEPSIPISLPGLESEADPSTYYSTTDRIRRDGDWTLQAVISTTDLSLTGRLHVGRDVRRWCLARRMLAQSRDMLRHAPGQ
jgi:hypothetical protein